MTVNAPLIWSRGRGYSSCLQVTAKLQPFLQETPIDEQTNMFTFTLKVNHLTFHPIVSFDCGSKPDHSISFENMKTSNCLQGKKSPELQEAGTWNLFAQLSKLTNSVTGSEKKRVSNGDNH